MLAREGMESASRNRRPCPEAACNRSPGGDMRSTRACTTSAACRPAASCAVTSNISASSAHCACGRSTRHSTSCRCPEPGRLRLHARLRSLRKAPRGMVPARKGGSAATREAARNRRQHRYRGAPHGAVVGRGNEIPRGTGGRIHRRMSRRPAAAQCPRGDEPPLRRRARKFDALPPRDGKPLEHRGRLPLYGRDAADRRRTGGEDPRARRDDAGAEPRRSPAHRRRRITGVELADGRMLRAKTVISAIHPAETFRLIGPTPSIRKAFRERIGSLPTRTGSSRHTCC